MAGTNVFHNAVDPPRGKSIRSSLAEKDGVRSKMQEITVAEMFESYVPGSDPSMETQSRFRPIISASRSAQDNGNGAVNIKVNGERSNDAKSQTTIWTEWLCMIEICKISDSVVEAAHSVVLKPSAQRFKTYDTCHWPVQPGCKSKGKCKRTKDPASPSESEEGKSGTQPDGGVYAVNDRTNKCVAISDTTLIKESNISAAAKEVRKGWVGHCSWADLIIPIEVKVDRSRSAFTFGDKRDHFLVNTEKGVEALGQILEYVGQVFTHQHRTHVFALYVFRHQARILYFDRAGCTVSEPFACGGGTDTPLHRFFWRLAHMSSEQQGYDCSAKLASEDEVKAMLDYARNGAPTNFIKEQISYALSWDLTEEGPRSTQWPAYKITMGNRTLLVARPMASAQSLHGRCTRGYLAYDLERQTVGFLKDSWRPDVTRIPPENEVYARLADAKVSNIATCDAHGSVLDSQGNLQVTKTQKAKDTASKPGVRRRHYRILLREVCRPLIDFKDFRELASLLFDAMIAHEDAWFKGAVLHRDISVNNILILESGNGDNITRRGLLNDWDLCKYKEQMNDNMGPRQPNLSGTWYYRSALSLQYPYKPYRISDDIESFIHVYHYCIYRFYKTSATADLPTFINQLYGVSTVENGIRIGGVQKLLHMYFPRPAIKLVDGNKTLLKCLAALHDVYHPHYKAIDPDRYETSYGATCHSGQHITEDGTKPLDTHDRLKDVFSQFGGRTSGLVGNPTIVWEEEELTKTEDLFELAGRKNAQLSSSVNWNFEDIVAERPIKRMKTGDMSETLPSITESLCEG
ncbi:hypothetical protein DENSPDRAFT_827176 [Dentipellis sp. KUC8613]|nr:hypothetical protein DENSPDRAFT_827176 [Dentipellis sp. KUC8613]